jgi:hypothetical protein
LNHIPPSLSFTARPNHAQVSKKMKAEGDFYKEKHGLAEYSTGS